MHQPQHTYIFKLIFATQGFKEGTWIQKTKANEFKVSYWQLTNNRFSNSKKNHTTAS